MRLRLSLIAILAITTALVLACNSAEKPAANTSTTVRPAAAPSPSLSGEIPTVTADGVRRVTTVELRELLAKNEAVVIDVRNEPSFAAGHIRGAKLIPFADVVKHANELPKDKLIVTYCS